MTPRIVEIVMDGDAPLMMITWTWGILSWVQFVDLPDVGE